MKALLETWHYEPYTYERPDRRCLEQLIPGFMAASLCCALLAGCAAPLPPGVELSSPAGQVVFDATLWQATRETLDFMPVESADPLAGTFETGWGEPLGGTGFDRYRVAVRLNYRLAYADAATVTVDHQSLVDGAWVEAAPDIPATYALAASIATRAGELRMAANSSKSGS
jgi:hypothetical protein